MIVGGRGIAVLVADLNADILLTDMPLQPLQFLFTSPFWNDFFTLLIIFEKTHNLYSLSSSPMSEGDLTFMSFLYFFVGKHRK